MSRRREMATRDSTTNAAATNFRGSLREGAGNNVGYNTNANNDELSPDFSRTLSQEINARFGLSTDVGIGFRPDANESGNDLESEEIEPYMNTFDTDTEFEDTWKDNDVSETKMMNPEEKGNYFEGDMMMSKEEVMSLFSISRSGIKMGNRWPIKGTWDKKPEVPYVMNNAYSKFIQIKCKSIKKNPTNMNLIS